MKLGLPALLSSVLLLWISELAQESSGGEETVLKQTVAKDIRDQITEKDLRAIRAVLETHFLEPVPEGIELHSAIEFNGTRVLHVGLDLPSDQFGENSKYVIDLASEFEGKPWKLDQIMVHSEQTVSGHDDPISVMGALEQDTVVELVEHASRFWITSGAGPMKISSVSSNALPPLRLPPESLQGKVPWAIYIVHVSSLEPVKPYIHPGSESANIAIASMSSDSTFSIWLKRDERGQLVTTDVYSTGFPVTDPDRLELLRGHVEQRSEPSVAQQRMEAALAVVPETARAVEMQGTWMMLHGQMESFMMHFPEAQVSDRRRASGMVNCVRVAGTDAPWHCSYQVMSATQRVPEQKTPIMLSLDIDEDLVDDIADALRTALAQHPSMAPSEENIEISIISPDVESWKAILRRGLNSYSVSFRYDGELEILAVEPRG